MTEGEQKHDYYNRTEMVRHRSLCLPAHYELPDFVRRHPHVYNRHQEYILMKIIHEILIWTIGMPVALVSYITCFVAQGWEVGKMAFHDIEDKS